MYKKIRKLISDPKLFFADFYKKHFNKCDKEIKEKFILYESYHGASMSCSPYAIFKTLLNDKRFNDYTHVWVLNNLDTEKVRSYKKIKNVIFIQRKSKRYKQYLCTVKYLINNTSFLPYFSKREGQVYINTWHGTPIKTLGKNIINSFGGAANITRNFLHADILIMPNSYTTKVMLDSFDLTTLYPGKIFETGYPRVDLTFVKEEETKSIKNKLGIKEDQKVLLYAPTYRGDYNNPFSKIVEKENLLITLSKDYKNNFVILYNPHYFEKDDTFLDADNIIGYGAYYETTEILGIVDLLITDYSSVVFDYMHLNRPIIYYAYDKDEYTKQRGVYVDLDELPGTVCQDIASVEKELNLYLDSPYRETINYDTKKVFIKYSDSQATKRAIESIFFDDVKYQVKTTEKTEKKKLLFYAGGFAKNGITSSIVALLTNVDKEIYDIYLIFDKNMKIENRERFINNIDFDEINIIYYIPSSSIVSKNKELKYKFEAKRLFGDAEFDVIVEASGYGQFWSGLFQYIKTKKRWIYLHSDMKEESRMRPHLANFDYLFSLYESTFDKLICVSKSSYEANMLSFPHLKDKMTYINNIIDVKQIRHLSTFAQVDPKMTNFINIGRYTYEKGQDRLISAFAKLEKIHPDIRLYIVGYGEQYNELYMLIKILNITGKVFLTGLIENPFPLLSRCDCMVMSSYYEGQGIVILESLALGIPCISTDIPGPNSILDEAFLFDNSEEGLYKGMEMHLLGSLPKNNFDFEHYNEASLTKLTLEISN